MSTIASALRPIASMPVHARVWVYKSARAFTPEERRTILEKGSAFTGSWATHGTPLDASVDILHDHFVVVAVDEQQAMASGCSIDTSVRFVQDLERDAGLRLTDRMVVLYETADGLRSCRVPEVEALVRKGELTADTIVFDDLVSTKADLDARFRVRLADTWLARYL